MEIIYNTTKDGMEKTIQALRKDLISISTGRANSNLLDTVRIESYGNLVPLNQIANISVSDSSTISIQPWDKSMVNPIDKAITMANLGFTPKVDGNMIRVNVPKLSEERRKELCKLVKKYAEEKKVSVRNTRREALDEVKRKKDDFSEDERKRFDEKIQKLTDEFVAKIDELSVEKEKDILKI